MSDNERVRLTPEQAVSMLPDGDRIHTFVNPGVGMLIGADWSRKRVLESFAQFTPELAGERATEMGHGICFHDGSRWVFVQTRHPEPAQ